MIRLNKLFVIGFITSLLTTSAYADTIYGLYADANYWNTTANVALEDTQIAEYDKNNQMMASAQLEHGVPIIPNAYVARTVLSTAKSDPSGSFVEHKVDATTTDLVAYYELLDNVVSADIGLGAKVIDGESQLIALDKVTVDTSSLNATLPMAYASVGAKLPFTGLSAKAKLGMTRGLDVDMTDAQAEIKYNFVDKMLVDIGAKAGYRMLNLTYDTDDVKLSTDFEGPYVGLEIHF